MTTLKKPPIAEAWVGLQFERNPDGPVWEMRTAHKFFSEYQDAFADAQVDHQVPIKSENPQELPTVVAEEISFLRMRVWNESQTRAMEIREDRLIYNIVEAGAAYPGFKQLCFEATSKFEDYLAFFQPKSIRAAAIHYLDVIEIPTVQHRIDRLSDYFAIAAELPEHPFGNAVGFSYENTFESPIDDGLLFVRLEPLPVEPGSEFARFRLSWQKNCDNLNTLDVSDVQRRLDTSHEYMRECFRAFLTEQTWQLFEPLDKE